MEQVAHQITQLDVAKNTVEVVVHISEHLDDKQRNNLAVALENRNGIVSAEFCHLRDHLMLVRYDRDHYSSQDVLNAFRAQKINARLIGPI
jgi:cell division protein FtsX